MQIHRLLLLLLFVVVSFRFVFCSIEEENAAQSQSNQDNTKSTPNPSVDLSSLSGHSSALDSLGELSASLPRRSSRSASDPLTTEESSRLADLMETAARHRFALPRDQTYNHTDHMRHKLSIQHQILRSSDIESEITSALELYYQAIGEFNSPEALTAVGEIHYFGEGGIPVNYTKSAIFFNMAADAGNALAQHYLAVLYATGLHGEVSPIQSVLYDSIAAYGGNPLAQLSMGWRHLSGASVAQSCELSIKYYSQVAQMVVEDLLENPISLLIERARLSDETLRDRSSEEDQEVVQYYEHRASQGDPAAAVALGQLYFYGARGFIQDPIMARRYFQLAADQDDPTGTYYLGVIHYYGLGLPRSDYSLAYEHYLRAVDLGSLRAHNGLGLIFLYGRGRPIDHNSALKHFKTSAEAGDSTGQFYLGQMYYSGNMGVEVRYSTALNYFGLAAVAGHTRAIYYLSLMHLQGHGTPPSCNQAVKLMKTVAERGVWALHMNHAHRLYRHGKPESALSYYVKLAMEGHEVAQSNTAWLASHNLIAAEIPASQLNSPDAAKLSTTPLRNYLTHQFYLHSSNQNSVDSLRLLGDYYYYTQKEYSQAAQHYSKASELRNAQALFNIGWMYQHGVGVERDFHLAKRHYDSALEVEPSAWMPVKLALLSMNSQTALEDSEWGRIVLEWLKAFAVSFLQFTRPGHIDGTSTIDFTRSNPSSMQTYVEWFDNFLESGEDLLLIALCLLVAVLVIFKRRRPQE